MGLIPAVDWLLQETCGKAQIAYEFHPSPGFPQLDSDTRIGLFRIAQEARSNVVRHSRARQCKVVLQDSKASTRLEICDDGTGLILPALPSQGPGLLAMRERARLLGASFDIERLEPGTRVRIDVPHLSAREKRPKVPPSWA